MTAEDVVYAALALLVVLVAVLARRIAPPSTPEERDRDRADDQTW